MINNLNEKQLKFIDEYLIDLNATQAAIRAGYSSKTAAQHASRLLTNVKICEELANKRTELSKKTEITPEWILENLKTVAERSMQSAPVLDRRGHPIEGEYQFDSTGANRALELLGKHLGMFVDRHKHEVEASVSVHDARRSLLEKITNKFLPRENQRSDS